MKMVRQDKKWLRMVLYETGEYAVQIRHWFRWRDVTFGPYGPFTVGLSRFSVRWVLEESYNECVRNKKSYTLRGASLVLADI
ncbi:hypothetical protein [Draconibacterium sp.]|uniref:hypothetical protein n=1 Tax=Draconibacterium sp. TaxID=1965318 RepID=UPI003564C235